MNQDKTLGNTPDKTLGKKQYKTLGIPGILGMTPGNTLGKTPGQILGRTLEIEVYPYLHPHVSLHHTLCRHHQLITHIWGIKGPLDPKGLQGHMVLMVSNLRHLHTMEAFQCILEGGPLVDPPSN